jgi:hypothetical protein
MAQKVGNDLWRTRLSRRHMVWLLPHLLPPPFSKLDRRHTGRLSKRDNLLTGLGGGGEMGEEPNHTTATKAWFSINDSRLSDMAYTIYVPAIFVACSVCSVALRDLISPTENICHFTSKISPTFHTRKVSLL